MDDVLERFTLLVGRFEVSHIKLVNVNKSLVQDSVVGLIKIDLVSLVLVKLVDLVEGISLSTEIFYRVYCLFKLLHALCNPFTRLLSAFAVDAGNKVLYLLNVPLRSGKKH